MYIHSNSNAMGPLSLVLFLSHTFISLMSLTAAQTFYSCYTTGNFTTNSTYGQNRNFALSSLSSNITAANGSFYSASIGQDSDKVYALALCRGDISSEKCYDCVNSTAQNLIKNCTNQKEGIMWADGPKCVVRYSNRDIFGVSEADAPLWAWFGVNISSDLDLQFDEKWPNLMKSTLSRAAMGSSRLKFATGEANLGDFTMIYALVQCTPDLSQSGCSGCLQKAVSTFQEHCRGKQGGVVLAPSCFMRSQLSPFYESTANASPPSPPLSSTRKEKESNRSRTVIIVVVPTVTCVMIITVCICIFLRARKPREKDETIEEIRSVDSLEFDFGTIRVATNNFSDANKLGQGGFGAVYKGRLSSGQDIAVKRLLMNSEQGEQEFKNEVLLVAKLQHRNLVRLLGFCLEGKERLLIYEFLSNKSLNHFIFDPIKSEQLDWESRYKIIVGIARGLLYLHEDSRLRIIHRDLKASNILLDAEMNPKISDFGMARLFVVDQTRGDTRRIVGTYGYMAPEYAYHGSFSVKSDVYSFGVLVLEIVSGQKNSCFRIGEDEEDLKSYAWKAWMEGRATALLDPTLRAGSRTEIMRCTHIGLLCIQESVADRPTMASVVLMLNSHSLTLPVPSRPAFFMYSMEMEMPSENNSRSTESDQSRFKSALLSINESSISELDLR